MGGVHRLMAEGGGGVPDQRDVISELHAEAAGRFDARVGDHADQDDMTNAVLLELHVEIGVGKAARSPMLVDNDIARPGLEVVMERSTPTVFGEDLRVGPGSIRARPPRWWS